jgi:hypothetical protein
MRLTEVQSSVRGQRHINFVPVVRVWTFVTVPTGVHNALDPTEDNPLLELFEAVSDVPDNGFSTVRQSGLFVKFQYVTIETCAQVAVDSAHDWVLLVTRGLPARPSAFTEQETGGVARPDVQVVLVALRNQLQVERGSEAPFYFGSADFLERVGESPNAFVTARVTADKE